MNNLRALAAEVLYQVVDQGQSLNQVLPIAASKVNPKEKALLQQLCYGVLRYLPSLEHYCRELLAKPLKGKQRVFQFLLYVGIYQLQHMRIPPHAAVAETVNALQALNAPGLKGLVNAVLRNFQRRQDELEQAAEQNEVCKYNHPGWFIKLIKSAYPKQWQQILAANQQQAPMWLRVNQQHHTTQQYLDKLNGASISARLVDGFTDAILLDSACDVFSLPGFADGACSVQDGAAQMAARLLDPQEGERILDACAAPGGKTCHILELANKLDVIALDCDQSRLNRVQENLDRIGLSATLQCADASTPDTWWDKQLFDKILLDVPCSATGVIRRHPDIKWLRRAADIEQLATLQASILETNWSLLKPGGTLIYATCSVLPQENSDQVKAFLAKHQDAVHQPLHNNDTLAQPGWQFLPELNDGFYYAKITKKL
ncbi:16S rRNA (cytosine967-C5)-methyltransferase [Pseudoalteromonas ulvae UL12]|uniref:16S rRNA (cytosine(967)-C(5))-methyltransferase RsmB n=1 Tax=Pseudoalteromonas ulvae TaxID=107327 RepID=UPI00186B5F5F|nr:16S rRNA (cytosine(967)-C(5))-methyltransferase RsmB [Pseudoalteromonas ulvae]MBE0364522.1 16S rRNA (cytosine967-C5)-methyltransferase [Pseudoalteromonas ulvae UL12]